MGNENGRSDVLYALVDDVTDLKARSDRIEERLTALQTDMTYVRRTVSDVAAIVQAIADKLVSISERLDDHGRRLVRIEALLTSGKA